MSNRSAAKVKLNSFDDLFGVSNMSTGEQVQDIPLSELYEFKGHPFRVLDDEKMQETVESIRCYGVLMPGIGRPRPEGGYEIIAGHRRKHGCELAGLSTMPMFIRNYNDDEATIIMVDSNIQREDILPSEKAKAYKMKYEALKHQGTAGGDSLEVMVAESNDSRKTIQRYICLSRLNDFLLEKIDTKKLPFLSGVSLSYLSSEEQEWITDMLVDGSSITTGQADKIKEYSQNGELTKAMVKLILTEEKTKPRKISLKNDKISQFFSDDISSKEIEETIYMLLNKWYETKEGINNET